jgi:hypothetical protein
MTTKRIAHMMQYADPTALPVEERAPATRGTTMHPRRSKGGKGMAALGPDGGSMSRVTISTAVLALGMKLVPNFPTHRVQAMKHSPELQ